MNVVHDVTKDGQIGKRNGNVLLCNTGHKKTVISDQRNYTVKTK